MNPLFFSTILALVLSAQSEMTLNCPAVCTTTSATTLESVSFPTFVPRHYRSGSATPTARCPRVRPTATITETISYPGTLTIPTPSGFTPILSEGTSITLRPVTQSEIQLSPTDVAFRVLYDKNSTKTMGTVTPESLHCTWQSKSIKTSTSASVTTCSFLEPSTYTETTTVATATHYAACDAVNLIDRGFGKGAGHGIISLTFRNRTLAYGTPSPSPYDCCVLCQLTSGCAYSYWWPSPQRNQSSCTLNFQDTCDGSLWLGTRFQYDTFEVGGRGPGEGFTVSNGACGQIVYAGADGCFPPCE
ncbi:MAG: hypothetical protein Q9167_000425 [Letrouitia subvulpina]